MTESIGSTPPTPLAESAFLEGIAASDAHIVDVLIEERCPKLRASAMWPIIRPPLYGLLGYKRAREMADEIVKMDGRGAFDRLSKQLAFDLSVTGLERLPKDGRVVIAANHPTGLADGIAVWDLISKVRKDIVFLANADAVRVNPSFQDVIIPVEWVMEKRTPGKTRETLKRSAQAFAEEKCVVIFPSGRLAKRVNGQLEEKDWFSTVVGLARKRKSHILPLNLDARNSALYYLFCNLNDELRDITLFHELLNKSGSKFRMTFGQLIAPERLEGDATELTARLKQHVAYDLGENPDAVFQNA